MTTSASANPKPTNPDAAGRYAAVHGLDLYYEVHGSGRPLVLLHGGLGTIEGMFGALLPALAATRQVIAVELQAHGHTADIDRPLSYEALADDIAALLQHLGLDQADILGYSLGGGVALQTAIRHPAAVRKLVLISTVYQREGWFPESREGMSALNAEAAAAMVGTPFQQAYARVAPRPDDWPRLVTRLSAMLRQDYDWAADVAAIRAPALIISADADGLRPKHALAMFQLFGGGKTDGFMVGRSASQWAVLPDSNHLTIITRTDLLLAIIPPFLDAPLPAGEASP